MGLLERVPLHGTYDGKFERQAGAFRIGDRVLRLLRIRRVKPKKAEAPRTLRSANQDLPGDPGRETASHTAVPVGRGAEVPTSTSTAPPACAAPTASVATSTPIAPVIAIVRASTSGAGTDESSVRPTSAMSANTEPVASLCQDGAGIGVPRGSFGEDLPPEQFVRLQNARDLDAFKASAQREANYQAQASLVARSRHLAELTARENARRDAELARAVDAVRRQGHELVARAAMSMPAPTPTVRPAAIAAVALVVDAPTCPAERDENARLLGRWIALGGSPAEIAAEIRLTGETMLEFLRRHFGRPAGGAS